VGLAVRALGELKRRLRPAVFAQLRLVLAGGYDVRVGENVGYYEELKQLAVVEGLAPSVDAFKPPLPGSAPVVPAPAAGGGAPGFAQVESCGPLTFVRSFSDEQKRALLAAAAAVVYTPTGEHFGIVPLECMAAYRPVVAVASAGPLESVVDGETGFLCAPTAEVRTRAAWAAVACLCVVVGGLALLARFRLLTRSPLSLVYCCHSLTQAFADALEKLVVAPQRALEMGRAGRAHVSAKFSRAAFGTQLNALVVGLASGAVVGSGSGAGVAGDGAAEGRPSQRRSARRRL
jgi:glycosyltransferase involved in cell wall biosynthesis